MLPWLWLRVQQVRALFVELVLQLQADIVRPDRADRFRHRIDPPVHLIFAELFRGCRAVAWVVIWIQGFLTVNWRTIAQTRGSESVETRQSLP